MPKAIVIGCNGQDGSLLCALLHQKDYMHAILRLGRPDDFVLATGILHSVQEFVEIAFSAVGLNWREHVVERHGVLEGRLAARPLCGNSEKLRRATGWRPRVSFEEMVRTMIAVEGGKSWSAFGA